MNIERANMIAKDLIKFYVGDNIKYSLNGRLRRANGRALGRWVLGKPVATEIQLNPKFIERANENDVIYTILHEIAHILTIGEGHSPLWKHVFNGLLEGWADASTYHPKHLIVNAVS